MFSLPDESCQKLNRALNIGIIHIIIKSCRFHLGKAQWQKIQRFDLAKEYKNDSNIIKWLHHFSGLVFLCLEEVRDSFAEAFISDMSNGKQVESFVDYVFSMYVDSTSLLPLYNWIEVTIMNKKPSTLIITRYVMRHSHQCLHFWMLLSSSKQQHT